MNIFKSKPKLDMRKYPHVSELYNQPIAIENDDVIYDLENHLVNVAMANENYSYDTSTIPTPYTVNTIGVIPIKGILCSSSNYDEMKAGVIGCDIIRGWINEALNDEMMQGIIFSVDCGGGSINGINALAEFIAEQKNNKSMTCFVDGCCASAAYWLMSSLDINITPTSQVGGIGVSFCLKDTSKYYKDQGIEVIQFKTSPYKGQGTDGVPITKEYKDELQKKAMQIGTRFNNVVLKYKQLSNPEQALNGLSYLDEEAIQLGLAQNMVSGIGDLIDTFQ
jgi:ClpP class serine protease